MIRLKNIKQVIYDANIIIYYVFPRGKYEIPPFTEISKRLTDYLFNQDSTITVPHFIISEIEHKGFENFINDNFKNMRQHSKLNLMIKIRNNFENLKNMKIFHKNIIIPPKIP